MNNHIEISFRSVTAADFNRYCDMVSLLLCFCPPDSNFAVFTVNAHTTEGSGVYYLRNRIEFQKYRGVWEVKSSLLTKDREESWDDDVEPPAPTEPEVYILGD